MGRDIAFYLSLALSAFLSLIRIDFIRSDFGPQIAHQAIVTAAVKR
jgi:hypothetical protein